MAKNLLDKDLMFSKIMPSSIRPDALGDTQELPAGFQPGVDDGIGMLKVKLFSRTEDWRGAGRGECTINIMENLVLEHLDEVIQKFNSCRCDRCRRDVAALAMNKLPPKYVVAEPAHVNEIMEKIPQKVILDALVQAIIRVRTYPRH